MQTFLPSPSYNESARLLDYKRLGKQRVETKQILLALAKTSGGWVNHPATKMWRGHEVSLCQYGAAMCWEWQRRGYKDTLHDFFANALLQYEEDGRTFMPPRWLGDDSVHASHRSNLLRKDPDYYGQFKWEEPPDLPYVWPTV
jgi:hypothetical protein